MHTVREIIGVSGARLATVRQKPQSLYFGGQTHLIAVKEATMNEQTNNEQCKTPYGPNKRTRKQAGGFVWRFAA
jgi:hypothetical protein